MMENWSAKQISIYEGLSSIGPEIAGFYKAGLEMLHGSCSNGANFLMHAAREIDGGLRDILAVDFKPDEDEKEGHKKSILFSLGVNEIEGLAKEWYTVSKKLHKYSHRRGAWKEAESQSSLDENAVGELL